MEECEFILDYDDYITLMMGAGVGYFIIGYLIASCFYEYRYKNQRNQQGDILLADPVPQF